MISCISVENMRLSDAYTIANFVPSLELMYRTAYGVFKAAAWEGRTAIVVGSGNNGGDGFALACILKEHIHAENAKKTGNDTDSLKSSIQAEVASILSGESDSEVFAKIILHSLTVFKDRRMELRLNHLPHVFQFVA